VVLLSASMLFWQLFVLFVCCLGVGRSLRFLFPKEFAPLPKFLFSLLAGFFLVVLIPQNLVYLGVPVRISAWLVLGAALVQVWLARDDYLHRIQTLYANGEDRTLGVVILLTITFHGLVPIQQGLEWYYGKGYNDQLNYGLLAEFLKEEPYSTSKQDIGLRPWLVRPVGFTFETEQLKGSLGTRVEIIGLKKERIGQSIVTAEIGAWSGSDGQGGYAATVIFFLTLLAICLYVLLRETGIDHFMAGSGAVLAALLPAVTRLSLNGFLSQVSILFVFPFFADLLRRQELSARSFTLFFSLTLAYLVSAYSEIAPIGFCTLLLGVMLVRHNTFRAKSLILMSAVVLVALLNPYYLGNLIAFLWKQYDIAGRGTFSKLAPDVLTLRGWSELIFGVFPNAPFAFFFDYCALVLGFLFVAGAIFLSGRDKLIFAAVLLPGIFLILYLATRTPPSSYPIAKITLTFLPFVIALVFVALSGVPRNNPNPYLGVLMKLLCGSIVVAAAVGSGRYYSEVLNDAGLLRYVREARFLNVCRDLEEIKNKRVLIFETHPFLTAWLCYHARHNDVYFAGQFIGDAPVPPLAPFSKIDLGDLDFVATRDRMVDLRAPSVSCLTSVDDAAGEDRADGHVRYLLGPPARLRFLALRPMSANLSMRLAPGPEATTFPVDLFLADDQGHVSQGEIRGKKVMVLRMNFPQGLSTLQLSVKAEASDSNGTPSLPILAELDGLEISDIDLNPGS
jgi:hypothetical protein